MFVISSSRALSAEEIVVESVYLSVVNAAEVPARDQGVLRKINVREGATVAAGDVVAQLNHTEARLELERFDRQLEVAESEADNDIPSQQAKKTIAVAKAELQRAIEANKRYPETVSQTEVDRLRLISEKAELDYAQAQHEQQLQKLNAELKQAERDLAAANLERRSIRAPIAGTIESIDKQPGEWVQPGTTIFRVIDLKTLRAEAVLPARYRDLDLLNAAVVIPVSRSDPSAEPVEISGRITFIHPQFDPIDGSFRVWAELDNQQLLLQPGESVTMRIETDKTLNSSTTSDSED